MSRTFEGAAQNSCYVFPGETTIAYKGMQSQRTWQLDINDVERLKKKVSRLETVTPIIQQWSKTFQYDSKKANGTMRGVRSDYINDLSMRQISSKSGKFALSEKELRKNCSLILKTHADVI